MVTTSLKGVVTELGKIPKLAPHMGWGGALKLKGGQALQSFWGSVSGKIMTVTAALLALKAVWDYFNDKNGFTFDAQMENIEEARDGYRETQKEIEQLTQQLDGYKESLNEIADGHNIDLSEFSELGDMIGELEQHDSLTLMEQVEIDKIKVANTELETQLRLKKELAHQEGRSTASEIIELLDK